MMLFYIHNRTQFFTSLCDSGGQTGINVLSVDMKSSIELITSLLALPVQVGQQLGQTFFSGNAQVPELY